MAITKTRILYRQKLFTKAKLPGFILLQCYFWSMKFLKGDSIVFIMMILSSSFLVLFTALFSSVEQNVQYSFTVIIECSQLIKQHTLVYIPILVNLWREGGGGENSCQNVPWGLNCEGQRKQLMIIGSTRNIRTITSLSTGHYFLTFNKLQTCVTSQMNG